MERYQKLALAALISVLFLIFVGAIVRATGSGLGCPDWPTCWGNLVPPWKVEQVDVDKIDLEKFRKKAERFGRDPASITRETLRAEFNPVHTWVEFVNRLCSLPVGVLTLATFVFSFGHWKERKSVVLAAFGSLFLVLFNAWLGAQVVMSGLKPGIITLHMALAILLVCLLVYVSWRARAVPWRRAMGGHGAGALWWVALGVFVLTVVEGVLGSQVRELTDEFAKEFGEAERSAWTDKLEHSAVYVIHRSFSWIIVLGTVVFLLMARRRLPGGLGWLEVSIGGLVGSLLLMGVVLAHVGVLRVVQVLHVGAAALLVCALFFWLLASRPARA